MEGELEPTLFGLDETGPIDAARVLLDELLLRPTDHVTRRAQAWVAGGVLRVLDQEGESLELTDAEGQLLEVLESIPPGGRSSLVEREDGVFEMSYSHP